jgi:thiamine biosynthesis lipoprotein
MTVHHREDVMGTVVVFDVAMDGDSDAEIVAAISRGTAILHRADSVFSTWNSESPISRLRRGEITLAEAPPEVAEVLDTCTALSALTRGWFDPWAMPGGVDPTGFVKGWAAQRALDELRSRGGASSAIVNAAGDIASFGCQASGEPFRIGIVEPQSPQTLAFVIELHAAIATSGTYERGQHLVDPRSGQHVSRAQSASVVGPDLGVADALATALAVSGEEGLSFVEGAEGYEGLVVLEGGKPKWTTCFPFAPDWAPR